jgi:hypothetical protein
MDEFFSGYWEPRCIFDTLRAAIDALGPIEVRVTKKPGRVPKEQSVRLGVGAGPLSAREARTIGAHNVVRQER